MPFARIDAIGDVPARGGRLALNVPEMRDKLQQLPVAEQPQHHVVHAARITS